MVVSMNDRNMTIKPMKTCFGVLLFIVSITFFTGCALEVLSPYEQESLPPVTGFQATFNETTNKVDLVWAKPDMSRMETGTLLHSYKVYRTLKVNEDGLPDEFNASGNRSAVISSDAVVTYNDERDVEEGVYYYYVEPVYLLPRNRLVQGQASVMDTCIVRQSLKFSINNGDIFVTDTLARVFLYDYKKQVQSYRLTDSYSGTGENKVPVFSAKLHPGNTAAGIVHSANGMDTVYSHNWILNEGIDDKIAFCEITYSDNTKDTIFDVIRIKPYRVSVKLRNLDVGPTKTMITRQEENRAVSSLQGIKKETFFIGRTSIQFSISIFNDTTFARDFDVWMAFPEGEQNFNISRSRILETKVNSQQLTGIGSFHNDKYVYNYQFGPDSVNGRQNIDTLRRTALNSVIKNSIESGSLEAVSGGFGGSLGTPIDVAGGLDRPIENFKKITELLAQNRIAGFKEFSLIFKFKGRFFKEVRTFATSAELDKNGPMLSFIDFYPPLVWLDKYEFEFYEDGDVLNGSFSLNLNKNGGIDFTGDNPKKQRGCVIDMSLADVAAIDLYVAERPESWENNWETLVRPSLTLDEILANRHRKFPFSIPSPTSIVYPVAWEDIDPTGWKSGDYIFVIVTEDEFGNRDIAPFNPNQNETKKFWNPISYRVLTGKTDL